MNDSAEIQHLTAPLVWIIMSLYGVIGYHVTLSEGHIIANHPI